VTDPFLLSSSGDAHAPAAPAGHADPPLQNTKIFISLLGLTAHDTVYQRLEPGASIDLG